MPNFQVSADINAFLQSEDEEAARVQLGLGSVEITDPDVAHIRSDGNDTTGTGAPGAPYLTAQAAIDDGFRVLDIGAECDAGNITFGGTQAETLYVRGRGPTSELGMINNPGWALTVEDAGMSVAILALVTMAPTNGASGAIVARRLSVSSLQAMSQNQTSEFTAPGNAGAVLVQGPAEVGQIDAYGGNFDNASSAGAENGGTGGAVSLEGQVKVVTALYFGGGTTNAPGGTNGSDGVLTLRNSFDIPTPAPNAGIVVGWGLVNGVGVSANF